MSSSEKAIKEEETKPIVDKDEQIKEALSDPTKKRKAEDEIEIDLNRTIPLSKKQKRLLRRGKITVEELNTKYNIDPSSIEEYNKEAKEKSGKKSKGSEDSSTAEDDESEAKAKAKKLEHGVWVGNLSFDTSREELIRFIVAKTRDNGKDDEKDDETDETTEKDNGVVTEKDIIKLSMPLRTTKNAPKSATASNKGFCYIYFKTEAQMNAVLALSESQLNSRNLLIKNCNSYEGRPDKNDLISMSKNPPSRILFVGNLSFDVTDELLKKHFQHSGEITKVRMATFEDSGKCKGFAFVDFKDEAGATAALKDKSCRKIAGRPLRMEFGEDRSKRQVRRKPQEDDRSFEKKFDHASTESRGVSESYNTNKPKEFKRFDDAKKPRHDKPRDRHRKIRPTERMTSSVALATAQRGSAAIVPSEGKKVKFN